MGKRAQWSLDLEKRFGIKYPHTEEERQQGVYAIKLIKDNSIQYIGSSHNLYQRCNNYNHKPKPNENHYILIWCWEHRGEWWFDLIERTNGLDNKQLHQLEKKFIETYNPPLTKRAGDNWPTEWKEKRSKDMVGKYVGESNPWYGHTGDKNPNSKKVFCVELNKTFAAVKEATRWLKENTKYSKAYPCPISECCDGKRCRKTAYGYHWRWAD